MKIYPVHISIEYKSGRLEQKSIKEDYDKWMKDLATAKQDGIIKHYIVETEQDRQTAKMKGSKSEYQRNEERASQSVRTSSPEKMGAKTNDRKTSVRK